MTELFNHGYALLIGVGQCTDPQLSLPVTVKDMQELRQILVNPELCAYPNGNLRLLHDQTATKSEILDNLAWLRDQIANDPEATVIVYYSGHGWLEQSTGGYYLIPHDFDRYEWRDTALSADDFNQALQAIKAKRLLVILDCCHAAGMASGKDPEAPLQLPKGVTPAPDPKGMLDALQKGEGRVVFTSCRGEEKSWIRQDNTMSVYTHHLIEALQGAASQVGATEVTVFDLANHLGQAVPATATAMGKQQNPRVEMRDTERFAIALLRGGKGLPAGGWNSNPPAQSASPVQTQVSASGERSVAIGGSASGSTIITGDRNVVGNQNVVQQGKYNFNAQNATGLHIGDKSFEPLPGDGQPLRPIQYVCPEAGCDISWVRRSVAHDIPQCPIHHVDLVPASRS
jgi:hypothetical protein